MVVGRKGTALDEKLVTIDTKGHCRLSNIETGEQIKETRYSTDPNAKCLKVITDQNQSMLVINSELSRKGLLTFIDIETFKVVNEVNLHHWAADITFNKRCNRLLAVTENGTIMYSKLWSK